MKIQVIIQYLGALELIEVIRKFPDGRVMIVNNQSYWVVDDKNDEIDKARAMDLKYAYLSKEERDRRKERDLANYEEYEKNYQGDNINPKTWREDVRRREEERIAKERGVPTKKKSTTENLGNALNSMADEITDMFTGGNSKR